MGKVKVQNVKPAGPKVNPNVSRHVKTGRLVSKKKVG